MAENNYDLEYTGSMVDRILDTGYDLQNQGYIFRGLASHYTGTPTERTWLIAPTGSTGFGLSSPVPPGSIGICMYNGSSWSAEVLNTLTLDTAPTTGSGNGITSGAVKMLAESIINAIGQLEQSVSDRFTSLELEDTTGSLQAELLSITLKYIFEGEEETLTSLSILAATAEKAGLMSAADKQKLDAFITNIRSLRIQDTTAQADQGTEITNTLKWTIGGVTEAITAFTLYAATTSKAGLMSAADKTALDTLPSLINAGYLYAGIATPSTVPSSTSAKIFYIAIEGGTYTNFGNLNVTQGINILYKSSDVWSLAQVVGIDDEPTAESEKLVKSGGVEKQNRISQLLTLDTTGNNAFDKNYIRANKIVRNQSPFDIYTFEGAVTTSFYKVPSTCQVITVGGLVASGTISWRLSKDVTDDAESISGVLSVGSLTRLEITPERREYPYFCATIWRGSDTPNLSDVFISFGDRFKDILGSSTPDEYDGNLFNTVGYIAWNTGDIVYGGYHATPLISITAGTVIDVNNYKGSPSTAAIAAYNSNNEYIQSDSIAGSTVDTLHYIVPAGVAFIRLCVNNNVLSTVTVSVLRASPFLIASDVTDDINADHDKVPNIGLVRDLAFGSNYNNDVLTNTGYFVYVSNGVYMEHADFVSSDYLPCKAGDQYYCLFCAENNAGVCFYDSSKQYLNEYWQSNGSDYQVFKVPDNAAFMRLSNRVTVVAEPEFRLINDQYNDLATLTRKVSILEEIISSIETGFSKSIIRLYPQQKLPCVSFQFDDIPAQDDAIVNLFDTYKLTCAFAFIASEANVMTKSKKYKELQHKGYQIMNHSIDGVPFNTTNYSYDTALAAIRTALYRIQDAGMVCNGFVAPSSTMAPSFMPILRMFQAYAFTSPTTSPTANGRNQDTCDLHRYSIQSNTIADIKQFIDDCITNDQIVTFYGHAADLIAGDESVWSINKIKSIIEYCLNKRESGLLYVGNTDDCVKYYFGL